MTSPPRSEHAEALRVSIERLRGLVAAQRWGALAAEQGELERAVEGVTAEAATLRAERDDARTETARAELHLTAARQVLEDGPDGYIVTDDTGIILQANRAAAQLLGVPLRFLVRKPLALFIDEVDLRIFRWRVNNAHSRSQGEWPVRMRPRQGPSFTAGLTVTAFVGHEGHASDLRWFMRDITARQRAEELATAQDFTNRMLESEQDARAAAEAARLRVEIQAAVSRVLAASLDYPAALSKVTGLVVPAVADVFLTDLLAGHTLEQMAMACADAAGAERLRARRPPDPSSDHPIARVIRTGDAMLMTEVSAPWLEHWAGSREGQDLWETIGLTSVVVVPIRSHRQTHGALTFGLGPSARRYSQADLGALKDIGLRTALALDTARLFKELEAEQRHRDEFLAMLAHELRNPLSAVTSGLDALERVDESSRAHLLQILSRQSKHLARLPSDLLDVSGVRFGRLMLQRQRLDLRDLARDSLEVFQTASKTMGPTISLRSDPGPVTVIGDADRLQQVLANLLDNAAKYTPSGGTIDISVAAEDDHAVVRVRDSGTGIEPGFLPRIFEVFSRAGGATGQARPGLGLGLSVVRELVVKHGGSVAASSPGVGQGSEFVIRLPLHRDEEVPSSGPTPSSAARSILIVEDNPDACDVLRIALEQGGHRVRTSSNGKQALEETRARRPDIAFVDILLPDLDGCEVGRTIRGQPGGDGVFLVALTGLSAPTDPDRALRAGFDSYLVKPIDPDRLSEVIAQARH